MSHCIFLLFSSSSSLSHLFTSHLFISSLALLLVFPAFFLLFLKIHSCFLPFVHCHSFIFIFIFVFFLLHSISVLRPLSPPHLLSTFSISIFFPFSPSHQSPFHFPSIFPSGVLDFLGFPSSLPPSPLLVTICSGVFDFLIMAWFPKALAVLPLRPPWPWRRCSSRRVKGLRRHSEINGRVPRAAKRLPQLLSVT